MSCLVHCSQARFPNKNRYDMNDVSFGVHIFVIGRFLNTCGILHTPIVGKNDLFDISLINKWFVQFWTTGTAHWECILHFMAWFKFRT